MAPRFPEDAILAGFSWSEKRHARHPHIIGLQEVTAGSVAGRVQVLKAEGFHHVKATVTDTSDVRRGAHASGVLIASRYPPNEHARVSFPVPSWEEKFLSVLVKPR